LKIIKIFITTRKNISNAFYPKEEEGEKRRRGGKLEW
jgi:hypothetical protein